MPTDNGLQPDGLPELVKLRAEWELLKDNLHNHEPFSVGWNYVARLLWGLEDIIGPAIKREWEVARMKRLNPDAYVTR